MKKILLIVSVVFALPMLLLAAETGTIRSPRPSRKVQDASKPLNENLTIVLEGAFVETEPFNLSSTVSSGSFNATLLTENNGAVIAVNYGVKERGDKFELTYRITTQVPVKNTKSGFVYRDLRVDGAVLLKPNESKTILSNGKNSVSVRVFPESLAQE